MNYIKNFKGFLFESAEALDIETLPNIDQLPTEEPDAQASAQKPVAAVRDAMPLDGVEGWLSELGTNVFGAGGKDAVLNQKAGQLDLNELEYKIMVRRENDGRSHPYKTQIQPGVSSLWLPIAVNAATPYVDGTKITTTQFAEVNIISPNYRCAALAAVKKLVNNNGDSFYRGSKGIPVSCIHCTTLKDGKEEYLVYFKLANGNWHYHCGTT